jgi:hypothetical protein
LKNQTERMKKEAVMSLSEQEQKKFIEFFSGYAII